MAVSLNMVMLIGRLGRDPEYRNTQAGGRFASLTVATSSFTKDKMTSEMKDNTEWHRVTVFNEFTVNSLEKYAAKGSLVYIQGSVRTRKFQDQSGQEREIKEIIISKYSGTVIVLENNKNRQRNSEHQEFSTDLSETPHSLNGAITSLEEEEETLF